MKLSLVISDCVVSEVNDSRTFGPGTEMICFSLSATEAIAFIQVLPVLWNRRRKYDLIDGGNIAFSSSHYMFHL